MYCKNCGSEVGANACFCEKCGALCGNNLFVYSRAKYFDSPLCSKKSRTLTLIGWILVVGISVMLIYSLALAMKAVPPVLNQLAESEDIGSAIKTMERLSGAPLGLTEEEILLFSADVNEFIQTISLILNITIIVSAVSALAVILLSIFAVYKKSFKCALRQQYFVRFLFLTL